MDEHDSTEMAEATRRLARTEDPVEREEPGARDFPGAVGPGGVPLGQQGIGQSDDIHAQAPAAGMARQHANPAIRRDVRVDPDRERATADDELAGRDD